MASFSRVRALGAALGLLLWAAGCGFLDAAGTPLVEAHRGGAGLWPENSRTAVQGTLDSGFEGLELDLVLTSDGVPVLSHDAALEPERCTLTDGSPLAQPVPIESKTLAQLQADYRCGGLRDEKKPGVQPVAEPLLSLEELLAMVRSDPALSLHLDVKAPRPSRHGAAGYAEAILSRLRAAAPPNPWYVSSNDPEMIRAFESRGDVRTQLSWPDYEEGPDGLVTIGTELFGSLGVVDLLSAVRAAGADGVSTNHKLLERHVLEAARAEGLEISLYTLDDGAALADVCRLPATQIISNHPERGPCR